LLQGAINRFFKKNIGGVQTRFSAVLPDAPESRERFLTRSEAAKLLWTAWRARKETKLLGRRPSHVTAYRSWYLSPDRRTGRKVDIETVSQYCGVSERVIRDTYRHVMASTFDEIMGASRNFGR
jgi:hypothetical protein